MARLLALNALLFLVPFGLYAGWLFVTRRTFGTAADWTNRIVLTLCGIGAVFALIGVIFLVSTQGTTTNERYTPADIQDGEIVPGRFGEE